MRIAVWHNLPNGGGKRALYDQIRGLIARGHIVEAWCPPSADQSYLPLSELIPEHVVPLASPLRDLRHTSARGPKLLRTIGPARRHCRECMEVISRGRFDVLLAGTCQFYHASSIARYARMPTVLYLQEPCRHRYEALPRLPWVAREVPARWWMSPVQISRILTNGLRLQTERLLAREELQNARAFGSILVNSYYSRESVLRAYGLDAKVCYLGVDTGLFVNHRRQRENIVVGIGSLTPEKNVDFVIRALARVKPPRPKLVWIGNYIKEAYLKQLVDLAKAYDLAFEPKLMVPDRDLVDILNRASVMAYAPRLEPFGFSPLEGNACGLSVVAVAEGGVRESVIDGVTGLLVEHEPDAMAAAIQRLLDSPNYARELGDNGCRIVAERWTLKHSADRLEARLFEAIKGPERAP